MDLGIKGRTAIVCGGSAGLGRGTATALSREGVRVFIAARDEGRLKKAADEIASETAGDFRSWSREDWIKAIDANMLSAIMLIKATIDGMIERRFGRIVNITSHMV